MAVKQAISCTNLTFSYFEETKPILEDVTLSVPEGQITVLMGSSGCGKSTLAAVLCGLLPENGGFLKNGEISIFDRKLSELSVSERALEISMMFQNPDLQFCMSTLMDELYFCMENISIPASEMKAKALHAAEVIGTTHLLERPLHTLSGGEKQRAVLTCIYLLNAKCILLDEPFANLDPDAVKELMVLLSRLCREEGKTIVAIDHMSDHWIGTADRFLILGKGGKVLRELTSEQLDEAKPIFAEQGIAYPGIWEETEVPRNLDPENGDGIVFEGLTTSKIPIKLKKKGLHKRLTIDESEALLYQADALLPKGKIIAILGSSGCGKTTLMMTLLKQRAYGGSMYVKLGDEKREIADIPLKECFSDVAIAFQNPSNQFITQNVTEEVTDGLKRRYPNESEEQINERAIALLDTCGLKPYQKFSPYMLSQGQQRRLAVLSVLSGGQKLLLLDEPTYGQDYQSARALMDQVRLKVMEEGLTVVMTTHDRGLANTYADVRFRMTDKKLIREVDGI